MLELNLPPYTPKIKKNDKLYIWDQIRSKYVALTPEEWVRQHFINYLITEKQYPPSLIANETQISLNTQRKRCDSVIYDNKLNPLVIVEYKSPDVKITQEVFDQIARYNIVLRVKYLIISNGMEHYCCCIDYDNLSFEYLSEIPLYTALENSL
ncbi:type I restriction enzyme HsdR N-terminal domain-containing protein [Dysgonomonas sp. HDW5A]|uniref:type I restriction enzyme HsdR N-terminal domain-containing protein n=1 Tax=Dysgonomonas sp. HDW5A TaxID=2714926 RepID=UPI00140C6355|nr:type I restriction enzyme HsdR N-terminal domain-containing protein [Dysgonomonas sp. HDW5A]QIK59100.1 type I restriction enzyme HsdR N-terminal domain-containing protein [Dysgonomonas sp. HDW5A]